MSRFSVALSGAKGLLALSITTVAVAGGVFAVASPAQAGTNTFCNGCQVYTIKTDPSAFYLTLVYGHYIGSGDRYMGAGAVGFGMQYGYNEVTHGFDGSHNTSGQVANEDVYSYITVNAHVDY
jgi:hypothetical protein